MNELELKEAVESTCYRIFKEGVKGHIDSCPVRSKLFDSLYKELYKKIKEDVEKEVIHRFDKSILKLPQYRLLNVRECKQLKSLASIRQSGIKAFLIVFSVIFLSCLGYVMQSGVNLLLFWRK